MKRFIGLSALLLWAGCSKDDPTDLGLQIISLAAKSQFATKITGVAGDEGAFGLREVATGDVNGDFIPDIVMGAPGADLDNRTNNGAVYVKFGATAATFPTGVVDTATVATSDIQYHGAFGSAAGFPLGSSIAVGDLNGDGIADIVMGDPDADQNGRTDSGSVYVIFGGAGIATGVHDLATEQLGARFDGAAAGESFGFSVAVGDINGDGIGDLIMGAPSRAPSAGSVYIRFGGTSFTTAVVDMAVAANADAVYTGSSSGDAFGFRVLVGHISGGALDDLIMTAPGLDFNFTNQGGVFAVPGGSVTGGNAFSANNILIGEMADGGFGRSISVGDVNGDGADDLLVGAPLNAQGRAYAIFGPAPTFGFKNLNGSAADITYIGEQVGDLFGTSILAVEHDGDSFPDVIIGAPATAFNARAASGSVYHFSGGPGIQTGTVTADTFDSRYEGATAGDRLGTRVAGADVSGDGQPDLIMMAPSFDFLPATESIRTDCGTAYVRIATAANTNVDMASPAEWRARFDGAAQGSRFDPFFTFADLNGDGVPDLVFGSSRSNQNNRPDSGSIYVKFGSASLATSQELSLANDSSYDLRIDGAFSGDQIGDRLGTMGDINGDGIDDLVIGSSASDNNGANSGSVYIIFGRTTWAQQAFNLANLADFDVRLDGAVPGDLFGFSVSVGDLNQDGIADLLVDAPTADPNARSNSGSLYVFNGRASWLPKVMDISLGLFSARLDGEVTGDSAGFSPVVADFDGDGTKDLAFTGLFTDFNAKANGGSVYIVYGTPGSPLSGTHDLAAAGEFSVRLDAEATNDGFGNQIFGADIDGDGKGDLAICASGFDGAAGANSGAAYVYFGGGRIPAGTYDQATAPRYDARIFGSTSNSSFVAATFTRFVRPDHADLVCSQVNTDSVFIFQGWNNRFGGDLQLGAGNHNLQVDACRPGNLISMAYSWSGSADVTGTNADSLVVVERQGDGAAWDAGAIYIIPRP